MVFHNEKELRDVEQRRIEARRRLVNKKPDLVNIEHVDYKANIIRRHKALLRTPCLDDNKYMHLNEFKEDEV